MPKINWWKHTRALFGTGMGWITGKKKPSLVHSVVFGTILPGWFTFCSGQNFYRRQLLENFWLIDIDETSRRNLNNRVQCTYIYYWQTWGCVTHYLSYQVKKLFCDLTAVHRYLIVLENFLLVCFVGFHEIFYLWRLRENLKFRHLFDYSLISTRKEFTLKTTNVKTSTLKLQSRILSKRESCHSYPGL